MSDTKKLRVAINGFGRIGRAFLKIAWERPEIEVVAINDLGSIESLTYLLKYDTVYRTWQKKIVHKDGEIIIDGMPVKFISEKDTTKLPWGVLNIDVVVESTGLFTAYEKAKFHIDQGAKKVVITAPSKGDGSFPGETILMSVNEDKFGTCDITSNASCTTNAASPIIGIMHETIGIQKAILNTVHGYTAADEVNEILKNASLDTHWSKVFAVTDEPLVSSDILGNSHASIADLALTRVVGGNLVKIMGWYDNEMGYTSTLVEHVIKTGETI